MHDFVYDFVCIQGTYHIFQSPYIPLKIPPGEALEGPFLISVRLNSGPAAVDPVANWLIDQIPAVF